LKGRALNAAVGEKYTAVMKRSCFQTWEKRWTRVARQAGSGDWPSVPRKGTLILGIMNARRSTVSLS
jgi:hypothetical protein